MTPRAEIEAANEAKSRFLATLGHEVRTPMTGVLGMAELLEGTPLDARQRGHVQAIHRAGEHLLRLVNDALDMARIEAGKLELAPAPFALRPLLDEVAWLMAPLAARKGLAFELHAAANLPANLPVQGNLDPLALIAGGAALDSAVDRILAAFPHRPHIFNLGHGIDQHTPIAHVEQVIARVRGSEAGGSGAHG